MVISTTSAEDHEALNMLDEVIENAKLVGEGELDESELPTIQILWENLCKILNVDA